jgi:hypothetical protein
VRGQRVKFRVRGGKAAPGFFWCEWLQGNWQRWSDFIAQRLLHEMRQVAAFIVSQFRGLGQQAVVEMDRCLRV